MGTDKIKYLILLLLLSAPVLFGQAEYVPYNHPVYDFLERLQSLHLIDNFSSFERPITRGAAAGFLKQAIANEAKLDNSDKGILNDYKTEFEYELYGSLNNSTSLFGSSGYEPFSGKEKYLYSMTDPGKAALFVNLTGDIESILRHDNEAGGSQAAAFVRYGGQLRGTFLDHFGFFVKGTNGRFWGNREAGRTINELKFNFKFNADPNRFSSTEYFDNAEGYFTAETEFLKFKIGRDRRTVGYGAVKQLLGDNTPQFDYISFNIDYKIFSFSYFHGKLLGDVSNVMDSVHGELTNVVEKYLGYHRFGLNLSRDFTFGIGEMIAYANRPADLTYLNPFNFYKSAEHANLDRDNSLLFLDFTNNTVKGLKFYGTVLIDDIDFNKLGSGWYGNQLSYNFLVHSSNLYGYFPAEGALQYLRVEPYVFTHRITANNFANSGYNLADPLQPNSDILILSINYRPHYRLKLGVDFSFMRHGANELNADGSLKKNVGGDIAIGHRNNDATEVRFLEGDREYYRSITFTAVFEPYNNYFVSGSMVMQNNSLRSDVHQRFLSAYLLINLRI